MSNIESTVTETYRATLTVVYPSDEGVAPASWDMQTSTHDTRAAVVREALEARESFHKAGFDVASIRVDRVTTTKVTAQSSEQLEL